MRQLILKPIKDTISGQSVSPNIHLIRRLESGNVRQSFISEEIYNIAIRTMWKSIDVKFKRNEAEKIILNRL